VWTIKKWGKVGQSIKKIAEFLSVVGLQFFMSDSSGAPSVPFTKSPIRQADRKPPSTLSLRSPSSQAVSGKDELIDEFQSKMSDLLTCQRELCSVKAQLDACQQQEREGRERENACQQELVMVRRRLQDLESTSKVAISQAEQIGKLRDECNRLKQIIEEQNRELGQRESNLLKQREAMEILQQTHKNEIHELEQRLRQSTRDAKQAKRENTELQRLQSATNQSMTQQQQELDELAEQKEVLEERNKKLREKKRKLKSQLRHSSDESTVQHTTIAEQHTLIQSLRTQKEKYKEKCADLTKAQAELIRLTQIISGLEAAQASTKSQIEELESNLAKATRKNKIASGVFTKIAALVGNPDSPKEILRNVGVLYQEMTELRKGSQRITELESACDTLKREKEELTDNIQRLKQMISASAHKLAIGKAIEQARRIAVQDLTVIGREFGSSRDEVPFRSVILTIIIGIRLRKLEKEFTKDTRNWWWLSRNRTTKLSKNLMKSAGLLKTLQEQNVTLSAEVKKLSKETLDVGVMKGSIDAKAIEYEQSVQFLRAEIKSLNEELASLIDPETYESLKAESLDRKRSLKTAIREVKALTNERQQLTEKLQEANFACQDQTNEIESLQEELEVSRLRIEQLSDELQLLQKVQIARSKELLSLERGIKREHVTNDRAVAQCQAMAMENRQLFNQMNPQKKERHSGDAVRLGFHSTKTLL
jgi:chromosome segregation ATPase